MDIFILIFSYLYILLIFVLFNLTINICETHSVSKDAKDVKPEHAPSRLISNITISLRHSVKIKSTHIRFSLSGQD